MRRISRKIGVSSRVDKIFLRSWILLRIPRKWGKINFGTLKKFKFFLRLMWKKKFFWCIVQIHRKKSLFEVSLKTKKFKQVCNFNFFAKLNFLISRSVLVTMFNPSNTNEDAPQEKTGIIFPLIAFIS